MKLEETVTGFNSSLAGQFVLIEGRNFKGEPVSYRGMVKSVEGDTMIVMTAGSYEKYNVNKEVFTFYEILFCYKHFVEAAVTEKENYELSVFMDPIEVTRGE